VLVLTLLFAGCGAIHNTGVLNVCPIQFGIASWYGDEFHGRLTRSGQKYNMHEFTAAHRTLPFGTIVRVTNIKNGRTVIVKINDRGPWKPDRAIDLSYAAAVKLGMIADGTTRVRLDVISEPMNSESLYDREYSDLRLTETYSTNQLAAARSMLTFGNTITQNAMEEFPPGVISD